MTAPLSPGSVSRISDHARNTGRVLQPGDWLGAVNRIQSLIFRPGLGWVAMDTSGVAFLQAGFPDGLESSAVPEHRRVLTPWPPAPDDPSVCDHSALEDVPGAEPVDGGVLRRCLLCLDELVEHPDGTRTEVRNEGES